MSLQTKLQEYYTYLVSNIYNMSQETKLTVTNIAKETTKVFQTIMPLLQEYVNSNNESKIHNMSQELDVFQTLMSLLHECVNVNSNNESKTHNMSQELDIFQIAHYSPISSDINNDNQQYDNLSLSMISTSYLPKENNCRSFIIYLIFLIFLIFFVIFIILFELKEDDKIQREEENEIQKDINFIEETLMEFSQDPKLDYNLRADFADVIFRIVSEENKVTAREIIMILGREKEERWQIEKIEKEERRQIEKIEKEERRQVENMEKEERRQVEKKVEKKVEYEINIFEYTEKSIAVFGDTKPIKDILYKEGGKYNSGLKCGPGWIFSSKKFSIENIKSFIPNNFIIKE